jgi:hypothetical protein
MARRYPIKNYKFERGKDWFYDRMFFDDIDHETVEIPMDEPKYMALNAIRQMCHDRLGDDYTGPIPKIEIKD